METNSDAFKNNVVSKFRFVAQISVAKHLHHNYKIHIMINRPP